MRFGLFTAAAPLAISDDSMFPTKKARKDEENNVIIAPKNVTTKNIRKGGVDSVLFSKPSYNAVGEPFNMTSAITTRK